MEFYLSWISPLYDNMQKKCMSTRSTNDRLHNIWLITETEFLLFSIPSAQSNKQLTNSSKKFDWGNALTISDQSQLYAKRLTLSITLRTLSSGTLSLVTPYLCHVFAVIWLLFQNWYLTQLYIFSPRLKSSDSETDSVFMFIMFLDGHI